MKIARVAPLYYETFEDSVNLVYKVEIAIDLEKPKTWRRYIEMDANFSDIEADVVAEFGCDAVYIQHCFYLPTYHRVSKYWDR